VIRIYFPRLVDGERSAEMPGQSSAAARAANAPSNNAPRGFTLVELLIALVVLDIGLLALVALGAALTQEMKGGRAARRATYIASARLERLASAPCEGPIAGTERTGNGIVEFFTDYSTANGARRISDSVRISTSRGVYVLLLRTGAHC
jgi:Tfp pilus assembly protein PilV